MLADAYGEAAGAAGAGRAALETEAAGLLALAREHVREGWCQGADATDNGGRPVQPWSEHARHWSLLGAIVAALDGPRAVPANRLSLPALAVAMATLADLIPEPSLARWNDSPNRSQAALVDLLARAHALCLARAHGRSGLARLQ